MTRIVALVSGFGRHVQDLIRAAGILNLDFRPVEFQKIEGWIGPSRSSITADKVDLAKAEAVLVRMMPPGSLEQVVFRMDALHRLAGGGTPVVNSPKAIEASVDKYLALARMERAGIPVPDTWTGEFARDALAAFEQLGGDVVVKPLFGSEGRGMTRLTDFETAGRIFHSLENQKMTIYLQKFVCHPGHDIRAFVLNDRVLGSIRRFAAEGDWRTNVAVGGRAEAIRLDRASESLALRAARAVGARVAGVDLIEDPQRGRLAIEVNAVPGWQALQTETGIDVAAEILADLRRLARGLS